jgi:DNA-binding beta-propeller fold protein YncE
MVFDLNIITDGEAMVKVLGQTTLTATTPGTTQGKVDSPRGLAYNAASNFLYVAEADNNRVMVFDVADITNGENAVNLLGNTDYTSATSGTTQGTLSAPTSLSFESGNKFLYVSDQSSSRILVFDVTSIDNGENATNVIGQNSTTDGLNYTLYYTKSEVNNGPNKVGFNLPKQATIDTTGHRLFVSDNRNNRVLVYNLNSSNVLTDYTADNVLGQQNFFINGITVDASTMNAPVGVLYEVARNYLYVSDTGNNRVLIFDVASIADGEAAINVLGQSLFTNSSSARTVSRLSAPQGLALDTTGNRLFVGDKTNNRVMIFDVATIGDGESAINVLGQTTFTAGSSGTTQAKFSAPYGVAYDASGNRLFVADYTNNRVMVFDVTIVGFTDGKNAANVLGQSLFTTSANGTTSSTLKLPIDVTYDGTDNVLFVADRSNNRVMAFNVASITDGEPAINVLGQSGFTTSSTGATQSTLNTPEGVMYDSVNSYLYVADKSNNRLMVFDASYNTAPTATISSAQQKSDGTGAVDVAVIVDDANDDNTVRLQMEYKLGADCSSGTSDPTIDTTDSNTTATFGDPKIDNAATYQVGSASGWITTSSGANTVNFDWLSATDLPAANGTYCIKITPYDGTAAGTAVTTTLTLDNVDPVGLAGVTSGAVNYTTVAFTWTAVTAETNWGASPAQAHYEIWYGTNQADVQNRTGTASEWDNSDNADMATQSTVATTITGLTNTTTYYFKIWVVDSYGGDTALTDISASTMALRQDVPGDTPSPVAVPVQIPIVPKNQCADGIDNDLDGLIDLNDSGCSSATDNDESDEVITSLTLSEPKDGVITNNNQPQIIGKTLQGLAAVDIYIDNIKLASLVSGVEKSFSWKTLPSLLDGVHSIYVSSGGLSSATSNITVDTVSPNAPIIDSVTVKEIKTKDTLVTANLQIKGQVYVDTKFVSLYLDDDVLISTIPIVGNSWLYDWSSDLVSGSHLISAKAIDSAQNISLFPVQTSFQITALKDVEPKKPVEKPPVEIKVDDVVPKETVKEKEPEIIPFIEPIEPTQSDKPITSSEPVKSTEPTAPVESEVAAEVVPVGNGEKINDGLTSADFVSEIKNKNAWDKTSEDQQIELIYDIDQTMKSTFVVNAVDGLAQVISNVFGQDLTEVTNNVEQTVKAVVKTTKQVQQKTIDNPIVEKVNNLSRKPTLAVVAATSVASLATVGATGASGATALTYFQFIFTQPFFLMIKRRKKGYGVIYNSITKQPVDLAVVRVYEAETKKLARSRVTDRQGRYEFILNPGKYYLSVEKKEFKFPCVLLKQAQGDSKYEDLYFGEELNITEKNAVAKNIPLDPNKALKTIKHEVQRLQAKHWQGVLTLFGPTLAVVSFVVNPQLWIGGTVVAQVAMYYVFKRLALGEKPSSWGYIRNSENKETLAQALVRVFDVKFNKLLDSQVTDAKGRYAFLVGNEEYYMTAQKAGYFEKRSERYDLSGKESGYLIEDFNLKPHHLGEEMEKAQFKGKPFTIKIDLGREEEQDIAGIKKLVRRDGEKFEGKLKEVDQAEMHEDFYNVDYLRA